MATFTANTNDKTRYTCTVAGNCKYTSVSTFIDKAGAWEVRFGITETNGVINDNFAYIVGLRHNQPPHGEPQGGVLTTKLIVVDADDYSHGSNSLPSTAIAIKHQNHYDVLTIGGVFTVDTTLNFDSITAYSIDVAIVHSDSLPRGVELTESLSGEQMGF